MENTTTKLNMKEKLVGVAAIGGLLFSVSYFTATGNVYGQTASIFCLGTLFGYLLRKEKKSKEITA